MLTCTKPTPSIYCEIVFLSHKKGGRAQPPPLWALQNYQYRPHVVVAAINRGHAAADDYLGVAFVDATGSTEPGEILLAEMALVYHPHVDYSARVVGAAFTIREGARVVGHGRVAD